MIDKLLEVLVTFPLFGSYDTKDEDEDELPVEPEYAFPHAGSGWCAEGLTKREWYAGHALTGILSNPSEQVSVEAAAKVAFKIADAMVEQGDKK